MQRLSAMDASFLFSEDGKSHNDIGMVLLMDGPALDHAGLMQAVADRLALIPRFRQKLRHMPYAAGLPAWVDDVGFDLARHIIEHPGPGDVADPVGAAVSTVMSGSLDLTVPLWQLHLFPGLPEDRWLVVVRMHHAMVDGVGSTEIVKVLLSSRPEGDPPVPDDWRPDPEPTDAQLIASSMAAAGKAAAQTLGGMLRPPAAPQQPTEVVDLSAVLRPGIGIGGHVLNGPIESGRRWGMLELDFGTIKSLRKRYGGTVNDLLLGICAAGLSSVVAARGEPVQDRVIRAMVPVSLRSSPPAASGGGAAEGGNDIGAMVIELPLGDLSPQARLSRIREQTETFKRLKEALPAPEINPGSELVSPLTLILGTRLAAFAPTVVNTVITNVPGPQVPLYLAGRRMHRLGACIALWSPLRIAVSVLSYDGTATIGVVTDAGSFPDVQPLLTAIASGVSQFEGDQLDGR